jgi:hypothetical protein
MIKKKDIDLNSIVRTSMSETAKENGFISEQKKQTVQTKYKLEEFDPEKHMPKMEITPKQWGIKGTTESNELDGILKGIVPEGTKGLNRFKLALQNMNSVLGISPGYHGLPVTMEQKVNTGKEILSALKLKNLLHSIIHNQSPQAVGKIFEGLVARMIGGSGTNDDDSLIQDLTDEDGSYISLKVIDKTATKIKGSKYNLAKGIVDSQSGAVTYLVCLKDSNSDPFSFKTYSFKIDRHNYFNFILGTNKSLTAEQILKASNDVIAAGTLKEEKVKYDQKTLRSAFQKYATDNLNVSLTGDEKKDNISVNTAIQNHFKSLLDGIKELSREQLNLITQPQYLGDSLSNLNNAIPDSVSGKNALKVEAFTDFIDKLENLKNVSLEEKAKIFEDNKENIDLLNGTGKYQQLKQSDKVRYEELKNALLNNRKNFYNRSFRDVYLKLLPMANFYNEIKKIFTQDIDADLQKDIEAGKQRAQQIQGEVSVQDAINQFFDKVRSPQYMQKARDTQTQFIITSNIAEDIAIKTGADYVNDYPEVIVDSGLLFTSATENSKYFKEVMQPVYEDMHYINYGINDYYTNDNPNGLTIAYDSTSELKVAIDNLSKVQDSKNLEENVNKPLTKSWSGVMLNELLDEFLN